MIFLMGQPGLYGMGLKTTGGARDFVRAVAVQRKTRVGNCGAVLADHIRTRSRQLFNTSRHSAVTAGLRVCCPPFSTSYAALKNLRRDLIDSVG